MALRTCSRRLEKQNDDADDVAVRSGSGGCGYGVWAKNHSNQGLSVNFNGDDEDPTRAIFSLNTNSRFFRKKRSSKILEYGDSKIELLWDLSNAKYDSSPEPLDEIALVCLSIVRFWDLSIALVLGDMAKEIALMIQK